MDLNELNVFLQGQLLQCDVFEVCIYTEYYNIQAHNLQRDAQMCDHL